MKLIDKTIRALGHFGIGMGIGFAATSIHVIATSPAPQPARLPAPAELAHATQARPARDAGVRTIAPTTEEVPARLHMFGRGPQRV